MKESESFAGQESVTASSHNPEHLEVPIEAVLSIQQSLMHTMLPERLKSYVVASDGEQVGIEDDLFMRWHEKYSADFRLFCDGLNQVTDAELIDRIKTNALTAEDLAIIQTYLENPSRGGAFFTNEELDEFIKPFVH